MERIVAIILALLVILVGFAVIMNIQETSGQPAEIANSAECLIQGGSCQDTCTGDTLEATCTEGVCCKKAS